ncbi:MAG: F0F1 ATP synthase subunit B [Calothrix sp. C42_A2020_038]|nr:F0F1 ATP synthase subunit B [Calothrix sp. C42_A2020_038]
MGIMGTLILLATEAVAGHAEEGGFGLNLDILETNIINLAILVGVLVVFGRKYLTDTLNARRTAIEIEIQEAEQRAKEAATALSEAQKNLTQAQQEAERIRQAAVENAQRAKDAILARLEVDIQRLKDVASADLNSERDKAIAQLRARVVALALDKAEAELRSGIADDAQHALIDRAVALLGGS